MAIDDPKAAFEQQYMQEEEDLPQGLAIFAGKVGGKLAFPGGGLALEILEKVADVLFNDVTVRERLKAMWDMFVMEISHLKTTKASREDIQTAIQLAFVYDRQQRDDKKRQRYLKLIGNALRSDKAISDIASFVQTIEQLNERDVTVLKVLNKVMNKEGDWKPQPNPGVGNVMKLHPSTLISRTQELAIQIAMALGQKIETNTFSREEGYGICNRLQGFGLAHEIEAQTRELPLTNYCFRLSTQGIRLLKLLGEEIPNFDNYLQG
jgi:hypothetical protein